MRQTFDEMIQQLLGMISAHNQVRPSHADVLPDCTCQECVRWKMEDDNLRLLLSKMGEQKAAGSGDPNADVMLQRNLAYEIMNLERTTVNLEMQLRGQRIGERFEGGVRAVR